MFDGVQYHLINSSEPVTVVLTKKSSVVLALQV